MRAMNTLPLIVEPAELSAHLADPGLLLVDLCSAEKYRDGHIPGAVHLNTAELIAGTKPAPGMLPTAEQLSALFARIGLTPEKQVVCYDDEGGPWAGRLIWTLDVIGHKNYAFLNGGKTAWVADGLPLETGENIAPLSPSKVNDKSILLLSLYAPKSCAHRSKHKQNKSKKQGA